MSLPQAVVAHWRAAKVTLRPPVPPSALERFEQRHSVQVPAELRQVLLLADGFEASSADAEGFRFLSLAEFVPAPDHGPTGSKALSATSFVFVDYLGWSWSYAVEMGEAARERVYLVGTADERPRVVSESVGEFLDLYCRDDPRLYEV